MTRIALICLALIALVGCEAPKADAPQSPETETFAPSPLPQPTTSETATMRVLVPLVAKWEGKENAAYLDRIASPPVWTVCYGETKGVGPGDTFTDNQCATMLRVRLVEFRNGLHRYFTQDTKTKRLPPKRDAAFVSLSYNVGIGGAGKSTAVRRLNAGDVRGACAAIGWWNKAGGRVIRGLVNRRAEETALCLDGVA